jgi:hypothetical protein
MSQVAEQKGMTRAGVHKAIQRGDIPAERVGHGWVIPEAALEAFQPASPQDKGFAGAGARWSNHVKEEKPKRPRGRPRKSEGEDHDR